MKKEVPLRFWATHWVATSKDPPAIAKLDLQWDDSGERIVFWRLCFYPNAAMITPLRVEHGEARTEKAARAAVRRTLRRYRKENP